MASPLGRCSADRGHVLSTETGSIIAAVATNDAPGEEE